MLKSKKGEEIVISNVIFILLNVLIFAALLIFVARAGSGVGFQEQKYAKKIALMIDQGKPDTEIKLDVSEVVEKYGRDVEVLEIFKLDKEENKVEVKFDKGKGYELEYFSDCDVELKSELDENNRNYLIMRVK